MGRRHNTAGGRVAPALEQDLHQVVGQVTARQVQPQNGVRQGVALVDGHLRKHQMTDCLVSYRSGCSRLQEIRSKVLGTRQLLQVEGTHAAQDPKELSKACVTILTVHSRE